MISTVFYLVDDVVRSQSSDAKNCGKEAVEQVVTSVSSSQYSLGADEVGAAPDALVKLDPETNTIVPNPIVLREKCTV